MSVIRIMLLGLFGCLTIVLVTLIVLAVRSATFSSGVSDIVSGMWGVVTLVDLSVGLMLVAVWIAVVEGRWQTAVPWIIGVLCLGNLTTLVYLMWRLVRQPKMQAVFVPTRWLP